MTEHIVALFETEDAAAAAERDLEAAGISSSAVRRYKPNETERLASQSSVSGTRETTHSSGGGFWAWLWGEDSDSVTSRTAYPTDGDVYERRVRAGNTVVSVRVDDDSMIHRAVSLIESHHPLNIDEYADETDPNGSLVQRGMAGESNLPGSGVDYSTSATATPATGMAAPSSVEPIMQAGASRPTGTEDEVIPLAEERLEVGKRTVDRGTTRVRRYAIDKPMEQNVTLHGERVTIERRHPVEGAAATGGAFEERTVEVRESEEVPVVEKTARVVEEVVIRKEATERTETIKDTVRHEEVDVTRNNGPAQSRP